jgi:hypothetical protein
LAGGEATAGVDLETGARLELDAGIMRVPVKARDFRLVAIPFHAAPPITAGDLAAAAAREIANPGFEDAMNGWGVVPVEGNAGSGSLDREVKFAGTASCHLRKVDGPGGMMVQTNDVFRILPGLKYRVSAQVRIANSTGAKAYWMLGPTDADGERVSDNNLFYGFLAQNQEWQPLTSSSCRRPVPTWSESTSSWPSPAQPMSGSTTSASSPSTPENPARLWLPRVPVPSAAPRKPETWEAPPGGERLTRCARGMHPPPTLPQPARPWNSPDRYPTEFAPSGPWCMGSAVPRRARPESSVAGAQNR